MAYNTWLCLLSVSVLDNARCFRRWLVIIGLVMESQNMYQKIYAMTYGITGQLRWITTALAFEYERSIILFQHSAHNASNHWTDNLLHQSHCHQLG